MRQIVTFSRRLSVMLAAAAVFTLCSVDAIASEAASGNAIQQRQQITGKVISGTDNSPVIGASVVLKSDPSVGTATDAEGNFSLNVAIGDVLEISYLGFSSQDVTVGTGTITVVLEEDALNVEDVVVTALGIRREKKALGYSVQEVSGDRIQENRSNNLINSLAGKVAGLNITKTSSPGGSSNITIRGNNSLGGNNQPLVVIDGIPFENSKGVGDATSVAWGGVDLGDGIAAMNPDDVESFSVLKGPAATALYGARGANGVILITTKKGGGLGTTVSYSTNLTFETVMTEPEFQNEYGQGLLGVFQKDARQSWGPRMEGQMIEDWTGQTRPFLPYDNSYSDFLQTGHTWTNSAEISSGNENASVRLGISNSQTKGYVPSNRFSKTNATLRGNGKLIGNLSFDAKITYMFQNGQNRPEFSVGSYNPIFGLLYNPRSIHFSDYLPVEDENGEIRIFESGTPSLILNPYWTTQKRYNNDKTNRVNGFASLKYDFTDWLNLTYRYGIDTYSTTIENSFAKGNRLSAVAYKDGRFNTTATNFSEVNTDFLLIAMKDNLGGSKFSGSLSFGGNVMTRNYRTQYANAQGLNVDGIYNLSNGLSITASNSKSREQMQSLYGMGQLSYDGFLYLDITARNDWSSTLPKDNWSFFYPSVSLGWIITDMIRSTGGTVPSWISYAKLRGSYAEAGNATSPYQLNPLMTLVSEVIDGVPGATLPSTRPNTDLKPEKTKSFEFGAELRLFNNRLGFDVTYYNNRTFNQILSVPVSNTSGYSSVLVNAGRIDNHGWEVVLNGTPVQTKDWNWNLAFNFAKNDSKVKELYEGIDTYTIGNPLGGNLYIIAQVGRPYGEIYSAGVKRDENGNKLVNDNGLYIVDNTIDYETGYGYRGNMNPDWTGGFSSNLSWKNFYFNFLVDIRVGGNIFLNSLMRLSQNGATKNTLPGRAEWYAGTGGYVADGIVESTGQRNTQAVNPQLFWNGLYGSFDQYIYKTTNVRMREMSFGYNFPAKWFRNTPIKGLKLSAVGNNLFFFYNAVPGFDPESFFSSGNAQGYEAASLPSTRSYGFNLNITF